jgi:hypothetical protein
VGTKSVWIQAIEEKKMIEDSYDIGTVGGRTHIRLFTLTDSALVYIRFPDEGVAMPINYLQAEALAHWLLRQAEKMRKK